MIPQCLSRVFRRGAAAARGNGRESDRGARGHGTRRTRGQVFVSHVCIDVHAIGMFVNCVLTYCIILVHR